MKRVDRLNQTSTSKEEAQVSHQVQQDKLQAQSDLLETQRQVSIYQQKLEDLKSAKVLSVSDIIKCQNDLDGYAAGEKAIEKLIKELF